MAQRRQERVRRLLAMRQPAGHHRRLSTDPPGDCPRPRVGGSTRRERAKAVRLHGRPARHGLARAAHHRTTTADLGAAAKFDRPSDRRRRRCTAPAVGTTAASPPSSAPAPDPSLPKHFRIARVGSVQGCQLDADTARCTNRLDPLPENDESWTGQLTGTLSGLTLTDGRVHPAAGLPPRRRSRLPDQPTPVRTRHLLIQCDTSAAVAGQAAAFGGRTLRTQDRRVERTYL